MGGRLKDGRKPRCACEECHYCGMPVAYSHQHDHFLVPKHAGGSATVAACANCHDLKDRTRFHDWNTSFAIDGVLGLFGRDLPGAEGWSERLAACLGRGDAEGLRACSKSGREALGA